MTSVSICFKICTKNGVSSVRYINRMKHQQMHFTCLCLLNHIMNFPLRVIKNSKSSLLSNRTLKRRNNDFPYILGYRGNNNYLKVWDHSACEKVCALKKFLLCVRPVRINVNNNVIFCNWENSRQQLFIFYLDQSLQFLLNYRSMLHSKKQTLKSSMLRHH